MLVREELDNWLKQLEENSIVMEQWNEIQTRSFVIDSLLNALGWNPFNPRVVQREVSVTMGSGTKRADYVLMSNNHYFCVIEAKAGITNLDDDFSREGISYAIFLHSPWALIINGEILYLFDVNLFHNNNNLKDSMVLELNFLEGSQQNRDELLNSLMLFAKGTLDSESGMEKIKKLKLRKEIYNFIDKNKEIILNQVIPEWVQNQRGGQIDIALIRDLANEVFSKKPAVSANNNVLTTHLPANTNEGFTVPGHWVHQPQLGAGIFVLRGDTEKRIDVNCSYRNLAEQLQKYNLRSQNINGFRYSLRRGLSRG